MSRWDMIKRALYEDTRYEVQRWPLWRWDKNLRYIAKSFAHRPQPLSQADRDHHQAMRRYCAGLRWPRAEITQRWSAVGDLMWLRDGYADFLSPALRQRFAHRDILFANLETPVDPAAPVKRWIYETVHYNAPGAYLDAWACAPQADRVFSLCNNHALDQGLEGLRATRAQVARRGLLPVGGAQSPQQALRLVERGGLRVAVLATTFGINGSPPAAEPAGVPVHGFGDPGSNTDWAQLQALIEEARALQPDWLVMMPHWGFEYEYWPDAAMRADAYRLLELGVDVILGTSPHVLQPVEVVSIDGWDPACPVQLRRGRAPRAGVIAYSLGNFASIIPTVACQTGGVLELALADDALAQVSFCPTLCMRGLGDRWLEARTLTLHEYKHRPMPGRPWQAYHDHARAILGPFLEEEST